MRVVGDLPRVAVGIDEDAAVPAPEGLGRLASDRRPGGTGLLDHLVDLGWGSKVERERRPAPAAGVLDAAVLRQPCSVPERDHHVAGLKEDDVVLWGGVRLPAQGFIEGAGALEIGDAEGDEADALLHG